MVLFVLLAVAFSLTALWALMRRPQAHAVGRRASVRLMLWAAAGLAVLSGCPLAGREPGASEDDGPDPSGVLAKWGRLGRLWREMTAHSRGERGGLTKGKPSFAALRDDIDSALDALPAWPELRLAFEDRWAHINGTLYRDPNVTCYIISPVGESALRTSRAIEKQVKELEALAGEGKLSTEALRKGADVLACHIEMSKRLDDAGAGSWRVLPELEKALDGGTLEVHEGAQLAGERLAELSADRLGDLAGEPTEGEGVSEPLQDQQPSAL